MHDNYHHGDLPSVLRSSTAALVAERGPRGFSLREVARRAGVSHAAPAHHFGDSRGLLTAVAVEGFTILADALEAASVGQACGRDRLAACGKAYVATALEYPGHYAVMLDPSIHDPDAADLSAEGMRAFSALVLTVEAIRDEENPDLDVDTAANLCWASMHGLVDLDDKMASIAERCGARVVSLDERVDRAVDLLFDGLRRSVVAV